MKGVYKFTFNIYIYIHFIFLGKKSMVRRWKGDGV